jgi:hypothetical protein
MKRVADLWQAYADRVLPKYAGAVQRQETRRAFYAGAGALFGAVVNGMTPGPEPQDDDIQALDSIEEEFEAFARDVAAGRA